MESPEEKQPPVQLETVVLNSIRHSFQTLDENHSGKVAKSQLQVLCASLCFDCIGAVYDAQHLTDFKSPSTTLNFQDFMEYLQDHLLLKAQGKIDYNKVHQLCWKIVQQKFLKSSNHKLSEEAAFKQFLLFNILDIEETSKVEKEEIGIILEKFAHAMGRGWDPNPLREFCEGEVMTFWQYLQCLEEKYIPGNNTSVVDEALEEVVDHVVNEVVKQGYLVKKGHKMKSMKERWFVLKPTNLTYFTNRTCSEQKGVITINKSASVESIAAKAKYRFSVKCGESEKVYELEAKDQKSRQEWIASIQAAIDTSDGPSPQKKERLQRRLDRIEKRQQKLEAERTKKEQENLLLAQREELARLKELYQQAEVQAAVDAALLQEEINRREELERLQTELQHLLETERRAKEEEEKARALQEKMLEDEKKRMEELERLRLEQERLLKEEMAMRENLEEQQKQQEKLLEDEVKMREELQEQHKQQEKLLEEERKILKQLEEEKLAAEQAMKEVEDKLAAAEEASKMAAENAKKKARELKTAVGLARTVGPHVPSWVTHRGLGAFCAGDFSSKPAEVASEQSVVTDGEKTSRDDTTVEPPEEKEAHTNGKCEDSTAE